MRILRTPDAAFGNLVDFPFAPHYADVSDGLRMHYLDEGPPDGEVVVLMHGEPSWSYLWRGVIPVLVGAGLRCVAPDLIGFGRSDKPARRAEHSYARHVEWTRRLLLGHLDLTGATLVGHDWGGLIGLRVLAESPDRFARIVAANTGLPTGEETLTDAFFAWRRLSQETPTFPVGTVVDAGCVTDLAPRVVAAYDAPFPAEEFKEGPRAMPLLVPTTPDDPAARANRRAWEVLRAWEKPVLTAFSDADPITAGGERVFQQAVPGARGRGHVTIAGAGHFLQEDRAAQLARAIAGFVRSSPPAAHAP